MILNHITPRVISLSQEKLGLLEGMRDGLLILISILEKEGDVSPNELSRQRGFMERIDEVDTAVSDAISELCPTLFDFGRLVEKEGGDATRLRSIISGQQELLHEINDLNLRSQQRIEEKAKELRTKIACIKRRAQSVTGYRVGGSLQTGNLLDIREKKR